MKKRLMAIGVIALTTLGITSCSSDDDGGAPKVERSNFTLELRNLEALQGDYQYEGWIIVNGQPVSTGTFSGSEENYTFSAEKAALEAATSFVVSIEPKNDSDPGPSKTKIMSGAFNNDVADLSIAEIADFDNISGGFVIATPTDDDATNETHGVWFLEVNSGVQEPSLMLPTLPEGWNYEGWVIIDDIPVSTGVFTKFDERDKFSPFSADINTPSFPGEDFLTSSITLNGKTLTFPADGDVTGKTVVISLEPSPDNDPSPFFLKPLEGMAGTDLAPAANAMQSTITNISRPLGEVKR